MATVALHSSVLLPLSCSAMLCCFLLLSHCDRAYGNVFAAHLRAAFVGPEIQMQYRLNEDASIVNVTVTGPLPSSEVIRTLSGTTTEGLNVVSWDLKNSLGEFVSTGSYQWSIQAIDLIGHTSQYDQLNSDSDTTAKYYHGCGVCANTNQDSDYFGCVYVSEGQGGTIDDRITTEGIFILNNDLTPFTDQGDAGYSGGLAWSSAGWFSPMRVRLDDAGNVIITDWSDSHSGLWIAPPDCSGAFQPLLTEEARNVEGLCQNHGSIMPIWTEGSGPDLVIYTMDEDYTVESETTGSILRYDVGNQREYAAAPAIVYNDGSHGDKIVYSRSQHLRDDSGWWITQYHPSETVENPWLIHWNGATIDYNSASAGLAVNGSFGALAISPDGERLLLGEQGYLAVLDISQAPAAVDVEGQISAYGTEVQDVGFDAAGNLMQINSSLERLRYYSPDDGPNSYTTRCPVSQRIEITQPLSGLPQTQWKSYR